MIVAMVIYMVIIFHDVDKTRDLSQHTFLNGI